MTHYWRIRKWLPERYGQLCKIVAGPSKLGTIMVEFEDGRQYVTCRYFVRKLKP